MAIQLQKGERDPQRIVDSVIQLNNGRANNVGDCTLTPGQAATVVKFVNCSIGCRVLLFAQTANAAAALATTFITKANIQQGSFTISHAINAQTDRTFSFACVGG